MLQGNGEILELCLLFVGSRVKALFNSKFKLSIVVKFNYTSA